MRAWWCWLLACGCNHILGNGEQLKTADASLDMCAAQGLPPTTLSGVVHAPNGTLPLFGALVYVPAGPLPAIPDTVGPPVCVPAPIASTQSDETGAFHLADVPTGDVELVVQIGKWRREHVTVTNVQPCTDNPVDPALTRLPQLASEGTLPHLAIATGATDTLECIARDLGVDPSEIGTGANFVGHVHLYVDNGEAAFGMMSQPLDPWTTLFPSLASYDLALFSCPGSVVAPPAGAPQLVQDWTNAGGWLVLEHSQSTFLSMGPTPWSGLATFAVTTVQLPTATITIDTALPIGQSYAHWLEGVGVADANGDMAIQMGKASCSAPDLAQVNVRMHLDPALNAGTAGVQSFTWDAANGGRVTFDDMHEGATVTAPPSYPSECVAPLPQETAMMFQLFETPTPICP
jgi:hypothetical protein